MQLLDKVYGQIGDNKATQLKTNAKIYAGEKISTGNSSSVILKFRDGSTFNIGSDAEVTLDEFVFNPLNSVTANTISVDSGAFSYTSGFSVKNPKVVIRLPSVELGVRGTIVDGFVNLKYPDYINIPVGEGVARNSGGIRKLSEGQSLALTDAKNKPVDPQSIPPAMQINAVNFIQSETDVTMSVAIPLTKEQRLEDALANRASITQQKKGVVNVPTSSKNTLLDWQISPIIEQAITAIDKELEFVANAFAFVQAVHAASAKDITQAMSHLATAAKVGLLRETLAPLSKQQKDAQRDFLTKIKKKFPDAAQILQRHKKKKIKSNRANKKQSTKGVIRGVATVAKDSYEVAAVVGSAVAASSKGDYEIAEDIVTSALTAEGLTDNANAAAVISAAAAQADPIIAENVAAIAVISLPESEQKQATIQVSSAVAMATPDKASTVAASVAKVAKQKDAANIAAAVTKAVNSANADDIAAAVAKVAKPEEAGNIAVAVTQIAGVDSAGDVSFAVTKSVGSHVAGAVAASVTQFTGTKGAVNVATSVTKAAGAQVAGKVAAVVTKIAGANSAANIAAAVIKVAGSSVAGEVAGAVTQVAGANVAADVAAAVINAAGVETTGIVAAMVTYIAGNEVSQDIIEAIATVSGQGVNDVEAARVDATKSDTFQTQIDAAKESAEQAVELEKNAIEAGKNAIEAEKSAVSAVAFAQSGAEIVSTISLQSDGNIEESQGDVDQQGVNDDTTTGTPDNENISSSNNDDVVTKEMVEEEQNVEESEISETISNQKPTAIALSSSLVDENSNTVSNIFIGNLSTTDADINDTHTYTIVGGDDQSMFYISDAKLYILAGKSIDYTTTKTLIVTVRTTDSSGNTYDEQFTINVNEVANNSPTAINLSASSIDEYANQTSDIVVGTLTTADADTDDTHTYTIVGGDNQSMFSISGNTLSVITGVTVEYEILQSLYVTVRTTDPDGNFYDETLKITVNEISNDPPTAITLSASSINEYSNLTNNVFVGTLSTTDPDTNDFHTYSIVSGDDKDMFFISRDSLFLSTKETLVYETSQSLSVTIRSTDLSSNTYEKAFTITVNEVTNSTPTAITLSASSIDEYANETSDVAVGALTTADAESYDSHTYSIVGGDDQAMFSIKDSTLYIVKGTTLDYETAQSLSVIIRTTDSDDNTLDSAFAININDINEALEVITFTNANPVEAISDGSGTVLGTFTHDDPDSGDTVTFSITSAINNSTSVDSTSLFFISGDDIAITTSGLEGVISETEYTITVQGVDSAGLGGEADFTISVTPTVYDNIDMSATDTTATIKSNSRIVYNNVRSTLSSGSSYSLSENDLLTLILGKLDQQITGGFSYTIDEIIDSIGANISQDNVVRVSFSLNKLDEINSKLNSDSSISNNLLSATTNLANFIDTNKVTITFVITVSVSANTVIGFDADNSTVQIVSDDSSIIHNYKVSELIDQYNSTINYIPSTIKFFKGDDNHISSGEIPTSYDLNASGNYLGGLLSAITFNDGSIELTP
ncbi:MAG: cadherin domain-containing protein [Magnetococcales bacterium]|nr:cadherin domain-containing protein [Magnetococcales bacterium]